jgi:hypothetical protein
MSLHERYVQGGRAVGGFAGNVGAGGNERLDLLEISLGYGPLKRFGRLG